MIDRESIYGGFWAGLQAVVGPSFTTKSRILKHWADVDGPLQPALFQAQGTETARTETGQPTKWEFRLKLYIYARADPAADTWPLNPLLDAVTNFITARNPVSGKSNLGHLIPGIEWARVDGVIETDEGVLGEQAMAIVPVLIFLTD